MKDIKAVLFDMDGVLVNTEATMLRSAKLALNEWNIFPADEDFTEFIGCGEDKFVGGVAEKHGVPYVQDMKKRAYEIYGELILGEIYVYPGTNDMLTELHNRGYRMAVCSSADRVKVEINIKAAKIDRELFDGISSANDVKRTKPFPDLFLRGSELTGIAPENCVVIEDAVSGIKAAKVAGMHNIAVSSTMTPDVLREQADPEVIVARTVDILELLPPLK
ncbi:MAG: HAD-IA family hydrolase [Clostridia bacterium]|nr:HAD-IA family hydrolase [Clostridia bacterium]